MDFKPTNILIFVALLGGIGHVMMFQDGYWSNAMWLSAILTVAIPLVLYKYVKKHETRKSRLRQRYAEI